MTVPGRLARSRGSSPRRTAGQVSSTTRGTDTRHCRGRKGYTCERHVKTCVPTGSRSGVSPGTGKSVNVCPFNATSTPDGLGRRWKSRSPGASVADGVAPTPGSIPSARSRRPGTSPTITASARSPVQRRTPSPTRRWRGVPSARTASVPAVRVWRRRCPGEDRSPRPAGRRHQDGAPGRPSICRSPSLPPCPSPTTGTPREPHKQYTRHADAGAHRVAELRSCHSLCVRVASSSCLCRGLGRALAAAGTRQQRDDAKKQAAISTEAPRAA
jgi:hypothetical protein